MITETQRNVQGWFLMHPDSTDSRASHELLLSRGTVHGARQALIRKGLLPPRPRKPQGTHHLAELLVQRSRIPTKTQLKILTFLASTAEGYATMSEIARATQMSRSTVYGAVVSMKGSSTPSAIPYGLVESGIHGNKSVVAITIMGFGVASLFGVV